MKIEDITKDFDDYVKEHDEALEEAEEQIDFEGKRLKTVLTNQLKLQMRWEILTKRITKIYDICEYVMDLSYNSSLSKELKDSYRQNTITEAKEFAKADETYKKARRLLIEIREVKDEAKGVLEVVNSRKYLLNNITNAMVASVEDTIL
tara:strand:- start:2140 stop:2586 length:447 start_codon:yes stop_codon:yes gene_type:complete